MSYFYTRSEINLRKGQVKFYFTELLSKSYAQLRSAQQKFGKPYYAYYRGRRIQGFKQNFKATKTPSFCLIVAYSLCFRWTKVTDKMMRVVSRCSEPLLKHKGRKSNGRVVDMTSTVSRLHSAIQFLISAFVLTKKRIHSSAFFTTLCLHIFVGLSTNKAFSALLTAPGSAANESRLL